ncbi:MAG: PQQ-binding-like beta-propeller repeat protein [ANME-2 cluster archaeon]|nr:PQQ-binding-like beta-propeller repeat protein [ANME-2 cluster archaeon]
MRKIFIVFLVLLTISIIISGCAEPYEVETPDTPTSTPKPTLTPKVTHTVNPEQLLSAPSWTWSSRIRIKEVDMSDDGNYIAGLSTQKVIVKTPTKNLLANLVWNSANHISVSSDGSYIAVGDDYFFKLYDNDGGELYSYTVGSNINHMGMLDNGIVIQGGEKTPVLNAVNTYGNEVWRWEPGVSTTKVLTFDYSADGENLLVGTTDDRVYYMTGNGNFIWYKRVSADVEDIEISDDGERLYALTVDNKIHSFDKYGNKNWEKALDVNTVDIEISKYGDYILTKPFNEAKSYSFKHNVYLLENNGNVKWMKQISTDVGVFGISKDAKYVLISEDRNLRMYDLAGKELASYHLENQYGSFFVSFGMTPNAGKLALGTTNSLLVFG